MQEKIITKFLIRLNFFNILLTKMLLKHSSLHRVKMLLGNWKYLSKLSKITKYYSKSFKIVKYLSKLCKIEQQLLKIYYSIQVEYK